jgi:hypothetical protein
MKAILKMLFTGMVMDWVTNRALHVPDSEVDKVAREVGVTVGQWRAVEARQAGRAAELWAKW